MNNNSKNIFMNDIKSNFVKNIDIINNYNSFKINNKKKSNYLNLLIKNLKVLKKHKIYLNIVLHSVTVSTITLYFLYSMLSESDNYSYTNNKLNDYIIFIKKKDNEFPYLVDLYFEKIFEAAILHDIGKLFQIEQNIDHCIAGYKILKKESNYAFHALISKYHTIPYFKTYINTFPISIVNLADKCVKHSSLTTIDERFLDLKNRYPKYKKTFNKSNLDLYKKYFNLLTDQKTYNNVIKEINQVNEEINNKTNIFRNK